MTTYTVLMGAECVRWGEDDIVDYLRQFGTVEGDVATHYGIIHLSVKTGDGRTVWVRLCRYIKGSWWTVGSPTDYQTRVCFIGLARYSRLFGEHRDRQTGDAADGPGCNPVRSGPRRRGGNCSHRPLPELRLVAFGRPFVSILLYSPGSTSQRRIMSVTARVRLGDEVVEWGPDDIRDYVEQFAHCYATGFDSFTGWYISRHGKIAAVTQHGGRLYWLKTGRPIKRLWCFLELARWLETP